MGLPVVVRWSTCSPSNLMIQVQIQLYGWSIVGQDWIFLDKKNILKLLISNQQLSRIMIIPPTVSFLCLILKCSLDLLVNQALKCKIIWNKRSLFYKNMRMALIRRFDQNAFSTVHLLPQYGPYCFINNALSLSLFLSHTLFLLSWKVSFTQRPIKEASEMTSFTWDLSVRHTTQVGKL